MRLDNIIDQKTFRTKNEHYTVLKKTDKTYVIDHSRHGRFTLESEEEFEEFTRNNPPAEATPTPIMLTPLKE